MTASLTSLSRHEIGELASLARLSLTDDEVEELGRDLATILHHVAQLADVSVEGIEAMTHAVPMDLPLRVDTVMPSLSVADALSGAAATVGDSFVVPAAIASEES